jgi:hypothetical protein
MPRPTDDYDDDDRGDRPRRRDREDDYDDRGDRPRRRDDDFDDDRPRRGSAPSDAGNGLAVAALILGILSIFTLCLAGVPAVIVSLLALGKPAGRGMAVIGLILGGLGTVVGLGGGYYAYTQGMKNVRTTAARVSDMNNLKQIGIGFHSQASANWDGMQGPYASDNAGGTNTGLSWRVGMLPYIEQENLYRRFKMKEAWDSAANKSLSDTPIKTYTTPFDGPTASTNTPYRVFYGNGAIFRDDGKPTRITEIADGTSNTILVVHAADQVPWAAPRDFKYDPNGPLPKLGHPDMRGGTQVVMADGSVRFISDKVSDRTLRAAITANGGEMHDLDW